MVTGLRNLAEKRKVNPQVSVSLVPGQNQRALGHESRQHNGARATGMGVTGGPNRRLGPPASSTFTPPLRTEERRGSWPPLSRRAQASPAPAMRIVVLAICSPNSKWRVAERNPGSSTAPTRSRSRWFCPGLRKALRLTYAWTYAFFRDYASV